MAERPKLKPEVVTESKPKPDYDWECPGCGVARHGRKNVTCSNPDCVLNNVTNVLNWIETGELPAAILKRALVKAPVSNIVDQAWFERQLEINKNDLDTAITQQPSIFQQVAERYAIAISQRDQAKDLLKRREAKLYLQIKQEYQDKNEKVTESFLDASILIHPERKERQKALIAAEEEVNRWEGMKESFRQRSFMLRDLVTLEVASFHSDPSARGGDRRMLEEKQYADNRAALQAKREQQVRR